MTTAVLTAHTPNIESWAKRALKTKAAWCDRHGLELVVSDKPEDFPMGRHPAWRKISMIQEGFNRFDRLIWLDADCFVCDQNVNPEYFFDIPLTAPQPSGTAEIVVSKDRVDINTGVMFIKNTFWTTDFFECVWRYYPECWTANPWEQAAVIQEHRKRENTSRIGYVGEWANQGYWNFNWSKLPFIIHPWGYHGEVKDKALNIIMDRLCV